MQQLQGPCRRREQDAMQEHFTQGVRDQRQTNEAKADMHLAMHARARWLLLLLLLAEHEDAMQTRGGNRGHAGRGIAGENTVRGVEGWKQLVATRCMHA